MAPNRKSEVDEAVKDVDFDKNTYQVVFDTTAGKITMDLFPDVAPGHCKNIIGLTRIGFYNGIIFHRVIKGFMNQIGCPNGTGTGGPGYTIKQEFNAKPHELGTLSMARTNDPNSAGSQFFLCHGRVPHLDRQYTVFGQAADQASKDVILKIGDAPTGPNDRPVTEIKVTASEVVVSPR
ncbi:MAG: peptidylprolyl isomerase [Planctomycetota bacterium]|nr:peptidylprolyl isomerase [Planctomycetota bacterium]MDA1213522.1 peptidylprolyl isomerase [Planctomycetota bacterium]